MRCTKCGYISFDNLDSCSKCAARLADTAAHLQGATFRAAKPFFLGSVVSLASAADAGGGLMDMDISVTSEEMQQLDASLDEDMALSGDDMAGLDLDGLSDISDDMDRGAAPGAGSDDDEVLDLSDLMDDDEL